MNKQYDSLERFVIYANKKLKDDRKKCQNFLKETTRFQLKLKNQIGSNVPVYLISKGQGNPWRNNKDICPCHISNILEQVTEKCFPYLQKIFEQEGIRITQEQFNKIKNKAYKDCQSNSQPDDREGRITINEFNENAYQIFNEEIGNKIKFHLDKLQIKNHEEDLSPENKYNLRNLKQEIFNTVNNTDYYNEEGFQRQFGIVYEGFKNTEHTQQIIEHYNLDKHFREKDYKRAAWGAYFKAQGKRKEYIEIYLDPIFNFSKRTGLDPYLMYRKVLIHELAHAYHHKGIDANGNIWDDFWKRNTSHSKKAEDNIIEGLAQWHTFYYMYSLDINGNKSKSIYSKSASQNPVFDNIFTMLTACKHQGKAYNYYKNWLLYSYENLRRAIMLARTKNNLIFEKDFDKELDQNHKNGY